MKSSTRFFIIGSIWLAAAVGLCAAGVPARLPMPFPQVLLASLTTLLLLLFGRVQTFRRWLLTIDLRGLLVIHSTRLVGGYFIAAYFRSELPYAFAIPAGIGDLIAVATAFPLLCISARPAWGRRIWIAWNILGLVDILFVIATATRLGLANPESMSALTRLPLGLLPTFVVPLIVFSHVVLFVRLLRPQLSIPQPMPNPSVEH